MHLRGDCYFVHNTHQDQTTAATWCEQEGAVMASITATTQHDFLLDTLRSKDLYTFLD